MDAHAREPSSSHPEASHSHAMPTLLRQGWEGVMGWGRGTREGRGVAYVRWVLVCVVVVVLSVGTWVWVTGGVGVVHTVVVCGSTCTHGGECGTRDGVVTHTHSGVTWCEHGHTARGGGG
jgi:hypothetical protein